MSDDFQIKFEALCSHISMQLTYMEKLNTWAEFAVAYCHEIALSKIDRSFYVFQSEPKEKPEILILGLNPYGIYNYNSMFNSSNDGWGLNSSQKMIAEVFIHQNPWYKGGRNESKQREWNILKNLDKTINVHDDFTKLFYDTVYMNILYFNSKDFNEFKNSFKENWQIVYLNCIKISSLLIFEIIKPKKIICLGIKNCFYPLIGELDSVEIIKRHLYKSKKNNFQIYGITHPSARISNHLREDIGWNLFNDLSGNSITTSLKKKISMIENILFEIAEGHNLFLYLDKDKLNKKFGSFTFNGGISNQFSIYFEFQFAFYTDLRYGLHNKNGFINKAIKCVAPFDNWIELEETFSHKAFKNYFNEAINSLL